jgi:hypothetical protein
MDMRIAARDLQVGDVFPGGGEVTRILNDIPGVIIVETDWDFRVGPFNHGEPLLIFREDREMERDHEAEQKRLDNEELYGHPDGWSGT